ncbi:rhomboid family intramembrane serine protease [Candidatus Dojkabacteria bacterium]|uniref:Rhomboid family intramembrane serine protease n=1 Tax=Candidatus Dojkabacteria bacterium TaxID=2099670 RepID=A0A3M0YZH3_9BACT|nr:MAG: rhomboid family intramembrane serine protease [Candidatus Dojkabacteria bacterium]
MKIIYNNPFLVILSINIVLYVFASLILILFGFDIDRLQLVNLMGAVSDKTVPDLRLWELLTANFVHVDLLHIFLNMFAFYQLAKTINTIFGQRVIWPIYVISGIFSSIFSIVFFLISRTQFASIGASGSIFGLFGFLFGCTIFYKLNSVPFPLNINDLLLSILLPISLLFFGSTYININHFAHLGGLLSGFLFGYFYPNFSMDSYLLNRLVQASSVLTFASLLFLLGAVLIAIL